MYTKSKYFIKKSQVYDKFIYSAVCSPQNALSFTKLSQAYSSQFSLSWNTSAIYNYYTKTNHFGDKKQTGTHNLYLFCLQYCQCDEAGRLSCARLHAQDRPANTVSHMISHMTSLTIVYLYPSAYLIFSQATCTNTCI